MLSILLGVLLLLLILFTPKMVPFKQFGHANVLQLLASLLVVALFVERALEVFVTTLRDPGKAELDSTIEALQRDISRLEKTHVGPGKGSKQKDALGQANKALEDSQRKRNQYRFHTQRCTLYSALLLGFFISFVGIRTLETFVASEILGKVPGWQAMLFHWVDVLLTGGLIAGGSEGIHKLTQVYTTYMDTAAKVRKDKAT